MSEEFKILSRKIDTLAEIVASSNPRARERVRREMTYVGDSKAPAEKNPNAENLVRQILLDIGAPDHLIGHPFTVEAVMLCVSDSSYANAITKKALSTDRRQVRLHRNQSGAGNPTSD